jgi:hypothetical protein
MSDYVTIPCYSLSPRTLTLYETIENLDGFGRSSEGWKNLEDNENKTGELSEHARKRLLKAINYLFYLTKEKEIHGKFIKSKFQENTTEFEKGAKYKNSVKYKLTFITLTLPAKQVHSDNEIKSKCLNHFLTVLRRKFKVELYIWKAEKQENGNIHFHIITDKYIQWKKIRTEWNNILQKLGYISSYQKNMQNYFLKGFRPSENPKDTRSPEAQKKAYEIGKSENWTNPNSTDIHALYKVKNVAAYISKYLAKGVTKTDRVIQIKKLNASKNEIEKRNIEIKKEIFCFTKTDKTHKRLSSELRKNLQQLENIENSLSTLLKLGVQGRIWGCSSNLSKCRNFSTSESFENIPNIQEVIKNSPDVYKTEIGSRTISTYLIDISKFPDLKANLDLHLQKSLNPDESFLL